KAVTTSGRRPSLTFGMHSITMNGLDSSVRGCTSANQAVIIAGGFRLLMSDPLRTDGTRAHDTAPTLDRDAKIEQLLLVGLDHYFAAQYEAAINVWTRALFLDRSHPRARAYIERGRSRRALVCQLLIRTRERRARRAPARVGRSAQEGRGGVPPRRWRRSAAPAAG